MHDVPRLDKCLYTLAEVAEITRRPPGLVRRWVYRRQLAVIWLADGTPCVPAAALRTRLLNPSRIERARREVSSREASRREASRREASRRAWDGTPGEGSAGR